MRRALIALLGTAAGTVLLVGAKAGFSSPAGPTPQPQSADKPEPSTPAAAGDVVPPGDVVPSGAGTLVSPPPGATLPASGVPKTAATTQVAAGRTSAPPPAARPTTAAPRRTTMKDGTFNGNSVYVDYGNVELSIVVSGGKITDIKVLDSPNSQSRSVQINSTALPKLRAEALAAQSAQIDTVSGATYTSNGYRQSLQSAIDRAYQA